MLEKYDPGLITGTIGAVIGIILTSIFEKGMIVLRFSKLRENLKDEVEGLKQKLRSATDGRVFDLEDLVKEGSKMVREQRVDVPPWYRVIRRYRESNEMAKLISRIETAQSLISYQEQTSHLLQTLISHQTSHLLQTLISHHETHKEQTSHLLQAHKEQTSHLLQTLTSHKEQTSSLISHQTSHLLQTLISHHEKTLTSHHEKTLTSHHEKTLTSHREQTSHLLQTLTAHKEQTSHLLQALKEQTSHLLQTLTSHKEQTDTAEEMTNEEKPMLELLRRAANAEKMVVLKCVMKDEKSIRRAMTMMIANGVVECRVELIAMDMTEKKITVIGNGSVVFRIARLLKKFGFAEQPSVGFAKEETKTEGEKKRC